MNDSAARIKKSPLLFTLRTIAPEIFHLWHQHVCEIYSTAAPEEQDDDRLLADMLEAFAGALESAQSDKHAESRQRSGWTHGYICGFVEGKLDTVWYNRYVLPHTGEYKQVLLLKSLLELFEADPQTRGKLWAMYQYISREFVFQHYGIHMDIPAQQMENVVRLADYDPTNQRAVAELWQWAKQHWEQQLEQQYITLLSRHDRHDGVPDLTQYMSEEEIEGLLEYQVGR